MSVQELPPLSVISADEGALSYLIRPEGSSGMGLRVTINPDGSTLFTPLDPRIKGFSLGVEASKMLHDVLRYHNDRNAIVFHLAV